MYVNKKNGIIKYFDFVLIDILSILFSFYISFFLKYQVVKIEHNYIKLLILIIVIQVIIVAFYNPFRDILKRNAYVEIRITFEYVSLNLLSIVLLFFVSKTGNLYSRLFMAYFYLIYAITSFILRSIYKNMLNNGFIKIPNKYRKSLVIISDKKNIDEIINTLKKNNMFKIVCVCITDDCSNIDKYNNIKKIGNLSSLVEWSCREQVDGVFVCVPSTKNIHNIIKKYTSAGIPTHMVINDEKQVYYENRIVEEISKYTVLTISNRIYTNRQIILKRIMDIAGGLVGTIFFLVLFIIIGPIIYIKSPGKIIYTSDRVGLNGKVFRMYKFRSMIPDAEKMKTKLLDKNIIGDGMMFKMENDPRIIPGIGQFIRKTSIDEFPQFINVLKGDMSLVGTRPPTVDEYLKYKPEHRIRLSIKPGITGMWQVSGRNNILNFKEVVELDKKYIENWNLGLDIKIIFKTFSVIFNKNNKAM